MTIRDLIFISLGLLISLIVMYLKFYVRFNNFIDKEIQKNNIYRSNAERDFIKSQGNNLLSEAEEGVVNATK